MSVSVNFEKKTKKIKVMHAVNNGPLRAHDVQQTRENFNAFKAAKIPYARNHDASFCAAYGGEHIVDVHAIFPDFNANPYNPDSYDFALTDDYLQDTIDAGTGIFYRLGSKIEHKRKKYGTIVPADFNKWAVICEHIIRHYNEGWADGFHHNIVYWEIWNEPDGKKGNGDQPNWSGTPEQFYELYVTAATHLKKCFPHLKIGGPAFSWVRNEEDEWIEGFFNALTADGKKVPLDFFSWHQYAVDPEWIVRSSKIVDGWLKKYGYTDTESIINEWNYVEGWTDKFVLTMRKIKSIWGAAFTAAVMIHCQNDSPIDMAMYYDARPCGFNGLFDDISLEPIKGYYPFLMFSRLYELEDQVECHSESPIYLTAAEKDNEKGIMLAYYNRSEETEEKKILIEFSGNDCDGEWQGELLDENNTMTPFDFKVINGKGEITLLNKSVIYLSKKS